MYVDDGLRALFGRWEGFEVSKPTETMGRFHGLTWKQAIRMARWEARSMSHAHV